MHRRESCCYCMARLSGEPQTCPACGQECRIALLTCVYPTGQHPAGTQWPLYARDYLIGRDPMNDIVINDIKVSRKHLALRYCGGVFNVEYFNDGGGVSRGTDSGQIIVGDGRMKILRLNEFNAKEYSKESARIFPRALSAASIIHKSSSVLEVQRTLVDAVLSITELDKGYFMSIGSDGGADVLTVNVGRTYATILPSAFVDVAGDDILAANNVHFTR